MKISFIKAKGNSHELRFLIAEYSAIEMQEGTSFKTAFNVQKTNNNSCNGKLTFLIHRWSCLVYSRKIMG